MTISALLAVGAMIVVSQDMTPRRRLAVAFLMIAASVAIGWARP